MENQKVRILLVDDTPENLDVLTGLLTDYKKSIAINGRDALKLANCSNKPDLILLDIMMPEMDGYETCKKLKENECTKDIPVIFMTALSETVDKVKGFELGAVDYITKPFEPQELLKRIETHLKISRLQDELKLQNALLEEKVAERTAQLERSNKDLLKAKEKAEAASKIKSEFLAQISHEIRTPINIIVSYSSLLAMENEDPEFQFSLNTINKACNRLTRTMDLIINLSEILSGTYEPIIESFNFYNDILLPISIKLKEFAKEKNIEIVINNGTTNSKLTTDINAVTQIITQLFENAIVYTEEGKIIINISEVDNNLSVEISDTGIGISEDYLKNLFEPFTQEETGYTRKYDGNGIGLALAKKYCNIINATINVESKKGVGSTFIVYFKQ